MRPAEQKISDPKEVKFLKRLMCYGMVRLRDPRNWGYNAAQQIKWTTKRGEVRKCDKHVSNKNAIIVSNRIYSPNDVQFTQGILFWADPTAPNATLEWINLACKELNGLKDNTNPDWEMRLYPGSDMTTDHSVPLDKILLDEDVVTLITTNHPDLLKDDKLFEDKASLRQFFSDKRDAGLIKTLFE